MPFEPEEMMVNVEDLAWMPFGEGSWGKVLRACPRCTGRMGRLRA